MRIFLIISIFVLVGCSRSPNLMNSYDDYPFVLPSGKVLLVVAHQDDEVFITSRIKRHLEFNDSVYIVWTAASYQKDDEYKNTRLRESENFLDFIKLKKQNTFNFLYPDGYVYKHLDSLIEKLTIVVKEIQPSIVYIQAFEGGHIDHDVSHFATVIALKENNSNAKIYEFPEYSSINTPFFLPFKMRELSNNYKTYVRKLYKEEKEFVYKAWDIFESQHFPLHYYIWLVSGLDKTFAYEYIRVLPKYDYTKRHSFGVAYEFYLESDFNDFKKAIKPFIN